MRNIRIEPRPEGHVLFVPYSPSGPQQRVAHELTPAELIELARQSLFAVGVDEDDVETWMDMAKTQHEDRETSQEQRYAG